MDKSRTTNRASTALRLLRAGKVAPLMRAVLPRKVFFHTDKLIMRTSSVLPLFRPLDRVSVRWAGPEDEAILQGLRPRGAVYQERFAAGMRCILGEYDGEPASLHWLDLRACHESTTNSFRYRLAPHACWCSEMRVIPKFRSTGLFHKHWTETMRLLAEIGIHTWYATVESGNQLARSSFRSLGCEFLYRVRVTRIAGITRYTVWNPDEDGPPVARGLGTWLGSDPATHRVNGPAADTGG